MINTRTANVLIWLEKHPELDGDTRLLITTLLNERDEAREELSLVGEQLDECIQHNYGE